MRQLIRAALAAWFFGTYCLAVDINALLIIFPVPYTILQQLRTAIKYKCKSFWDYNFCAELQGIANAVFTIQVNQQDSLEPITG